MGTLTFVVVAVVFAACASPTPTPTPTATSTPMPTATEAVATAAASPSPPVASPSPNVSPTASPLILEQGVVVGRELSCTTDLAQSKCDVLLAGALQSLPWLEEHLSATDVPSYAIHEAWDGPGVMRTTALLAVVALDLPDGRTIYVPVFCGPGNPLCDS